MNTMRAAARTGDTFLRENARDFFVVTFYQADQLDVAVAAVCTDHPDQHADLDVDVPVQTHEVALLTLGLFSS